MNRPKCKTCAYWNRFDRDEREGTCRRHAPPPRLEGELGDGESVLTAFWAIVSDNDWCGEHPDFPAYIASLKGREEERWPLTIAAIERLCDKLDVIREVNK